MVALQITYFTPKTNNGKETIWGATLSGNVGMQFTNLDSVSDLEGPSKSIGANTPILGFDLIKNDKTNDTVGWAVGLGPSKGADYHKNKTNTVGIKFRSVFKAFRDCLGI